MEKEKEIANQITNYVNNFSMDQEKFNQAMSMEHRTLQQSFTRLCLKWLEHVAKDDYRTDPRNEGAHKTAKEVIQSFKDMKGDDYNPSDYLGYI